MTAPNAALNAGSNATLNADAAELDKFAALAHHWWDAGGELATLHHINPLRLNWIEAQRPLQGARVLDVGCGGGILADAMARKGAEVLGIDLAEKSLQAARLHALEAETPRVSYRAVAAEALAAQEPASFDVVTCMEMLEHVPDPAAIVAACAALGAARSRLLAQLRGLLHYHCGRSLRTRQMMAELQQLQSAAAALSPLSPSSAPFPADPESE